MSFHTPSRYFVWFFFGIFGAHYWYKRKLFAQTRRHKLFLFFYLITLGGFGLFWLFDGFRVGNWVGGTIVVACCLLLLHDSHDLIWLTFLFRFFLFFPSPLPLFPLPPLPTPLSPHIFLLHRLHGTLSWTVRRRQLEHSCAEQQDCSRSARCRVPCHSS